MKIKYVGDHPQVWVPELDDVDGTPGGRWVKRDEPIDVDQSFGERAVQQVGVWQAVNTKGDSK